MGTNRTKVAVGVGGGSLYSDRPPFHPDTQYPEYPFAEIEPSTPNPAYRAVRDALRLLGLDAENFGTRAWNPLGGMVEPGMKVVIKPNFVLSKHPEGKDLFSVITHPSMLRAVADYVWIALRGKGRILFADAPQYDCNFNELLAATKLPEVAAFYNSQPAGLPVEIRDLRNYWSRKWHTLSSSKPLKGDPEGSVHLNLGGESAMAGCPHPENFYGAVYNRKETAAHHTGEKQEYELSKTIYGADFVISVPKLKVHKKVGVTLNVKGLVGTATNKNLLVHYRLHSTARGGDQYPPGLLNPMEEGILRLERWLHDMLLAPRIAPLEMIYRLISGVHHRTLHHLGIKVPQWKRRMDSGNWHGNDSAWRMSADLMLAFRFADAEGRLHERPQRRVFSFIDGIMAGENDGPLAPDPKPCGVVLAGENLLAVDLVATRLMGFDPLQLKMYRWLLESPKFDFGVRSLQEIDIGAENPAWAAAMDDPSSPFLGFKPHPGWVGAVEVGLPGQRAQFPDLQQKESLRAV